MKKELIKEVFYNLVNDANTGMTLSIDKEGFDYIRFNYIENGKFFGEGYTDDDYLGSEEMVDEEYDAEFSNGTANYLPTLRVDEPENFFNHLYDVICEYIEFYNLSKLFEKFGEENIIKNIILTVLTNARYQDYENPIPYLKRYLNFFKDETLTKYKNSIIGDEIENLENGYIVVNNTKDIYGYETPYAFHSTIRNNDTEYNLPIINYGISDDTCYIYSIQNKKKNEENSFNKKIKRNLNKVNGGVENDTDYDRNETILGTTPSFIVATAIFLQILKQNNIDKVRVVTFLPDRYFEKLGTSEYDADEIQKNLTEKMVLLFYRLKHHIPKIDINFPAVEGITQYTDGDVGDDLIVKLPDKIECENNAFLKEILSSMKKENKEKFENKER